MEVLKLRPGVELRNPTDPLGPPIGVVADGFCSLVMVNHPEDAIDELRAKATLIRQQQAIARKGAKHAVDRRRKRRKNSS